MSMVHLHLLLNHVPAVGAVLIAALFGIALIRKSSEIAKTALGAAVAVGIVALAVYFTGEPAEEAIEGMAGVSEGIIARHEDAALLATIAAAATGAVALALLAWFRGRPLSRLLAGVSLAGSLVLSGLMAWTANLGGQIRHTEIRADAITGGDGPAPQSGEGKDAHDDDSRRKDR